jgi:lipoprotein-anchoring transpeptidase ErfK/SrfK
MLAARRPITGARTVLPVISEAEDATGRRWLQVRLPGRVLGAPTPPRTGWISSFKARRSTTAWHVVVDLGDRRVRVYKGGRRVHSFAAVVGAPSTPTPTGRFFVEENVVMPAGLPGGPFALASSARSSVLQEFAGGPGQIALHGMRDVGGELGSAASHGCVRLADEPISWLAARIGPGVPVTVHAGD